MFFDATVQIADSESAILEHDGEAQGVQISYMIAAGLPTGQGLMPLPIGWLRLGMTKRGAIEHAEAILEMAEQLPDEKPASDLVVAKSLVGVEEAVKHTEKLKKGK